VSLDQSVATHDLIRLRDPGALTAEAPLPLWVEEALGRAPWVVVRRGGVSQGMLPIGVRGTTRSERFAAFLPINRVAERRSPEDLVSFLEAIDRERRDRVPALRALDRVAALLEHGSHRWGPVGSAGFEITTGVPTVTPVSDLDIILRRSHPLDPATALELHHLLSEAGAPARVDVMIETLAGGFLLAEYAKAPPRLLLRTPDGPRFVVDPWNADAPMDVLS